MIVIDPDGRSNSKEVSTKIKQFKKLNFLWLKIFHFKFICFSTILLQKSLCIKKQQNRYKYYQIKFSK